MKLDRFCLSLSLFLLGTIIHIDSKSTTEIEGHVAPPLPTLPPLDRPDPFMHNAGDRQFVPLPPRR
jgi:hypothetical protein